MRLVLLALAATALPLAAGAVPIEFGGTFGMGTPTTALSSPGQTFTLSFDLPSPLTFGAVATVDARYVTQGITSVFSTFVKIDPFGEGSDTLVASFSSMLTGYNFDLLVPRFVAPSSATTGALLNGVYVVTTETSTIVQGSEAPTSTTSDIVNVTGLRIGGDPVPEASSIAVALFGLGLLGFAMRRRTAR